MDDSYDPAVEPEEPVEPEAEEPTEAALAAPLVGAAAVATPMLNTTFEI